MFTFATMKPRASTTTIRHLVNPRISAMAFLVPVLLACSGCGDSKAPVAPATQAGSTPVAATPQAGSSKTDPLADVLRLAKAGDTDAAIQRFVANAPDNWFEATSLEDIRMSEAAYAAADRADKPRLQQKVNDRVGEIKSFARTVIERANQAKKRGDQQTAQQYLDAVNRFGRQLRDSDTVAVFQQTGNALANMALSE